MAQEPAAELATPAQGIRVCGRCRPCRDRRNAVPGEGPVTALHGGFVDSAERRYSVSYHPAAALGGGISLIPFPSRLRSHPYPR